MKEEIKVLNEMLKEEVRGRNDLKEEAKEQSERMVKTDGRLDAIEVAERQRDQKVGRLSAIVSKAVPWGEHHKVQKELHGERKLWVCELRQKIRHSIETLI